VVHFEGGGDLDFARGLGYSHAMDRLTQMIMQAVAGRGKLAEMMSDTPRARKMDYQFRSLDFEGIANRLWNEMDRGSGEAGQECKVFLQAYADGVNAYLNSYPFPFRTTLELALTGIWDLEWHPIDSLVTAGIFSYAGLGQLQDNVESFVLQLLTAPHVDLDRMKTLFAPHLKEVDEDLVGILKQLKYTDTGVIPLELWPEGKSTECAGESCAPASAAAPGAGAGAAGQAPPDSAAVDDAVPSFGASNNWAVHGSLTKTGGALLAMDPHLEVSRLPSAFVEAVFHDRRADLGCREDREEDHRASATQNGYLMGITLPGFPCMAFGRNKNVGWSVTYGVMDQIDYFVEEVRDGKVLRDGFWAPISGHRVTYRPKNGPEMELTFFKTPNGVLQTGNHTMEHPSLLEDGYYLSKAWSWQHYLQADHLRGLLQRPRWCDIREAMGRNVTSGMGPGGRTKIGAVNATASVPSVDQVTPFLEGNGKTSLSSTPITANWVLADSAGEIAYLQTGHLPLRTGSGLVPVPGWDPKRSWQGLADPKEALLAWANPQSGIIATANQKLEKFSGPAVVMNAYASPGRYDRAMQQLEYMTFEGHKVDVEDMKPLQHDLISLPASLTFLPRIKHALRDWEGEKLDRVKALLEWDGGFYHGSEGAQIFVDLYWQVMKQVYDPIFGDGVMHYIRDHTALFGVTQIRFEELVLRADLDSTLAQAWFGDPDLSLADVMAQAAEALWGDQAWAKKQQASEEEQGDETQGPKSAGLYSDKALVLKNVIFRGKPKFPGLQLGLDAGPVPLRGWYNTLHQQSTREPPSEHRLHVHGPVWRAVGDMSTEGLQTALAGGQSGRRFSSYYLSDFVRFFTGNYKRLSSKPREHQQVLNEAPH